ncbi:glyoxalase [Betaproteobacteria bacterium GR16-43]|nr:glyoxalase [Betaproteobacteria bacterium GR16-43]
MSELNAKHNRTVWVDIPVADLDRAAKFYNAVLALPIHKVAANGVNFCVLDHGEGNGGCLIASKDAVTSKGILVYMNVNGRIRDAVAKAVANGGKVLEDTVAIGPHGFRAVVLDSEGNRIALHSEKDL